MPEEPLEHDVVIVEHAGTFTIRRAIGVGLMTRHVDGPPVVAISRLEAIALGDDLAIQNGVDLWIVAGDEAQHLTTHRPPEQ